MFKPLLVWWIGLVSIRSTGQSALLITNRAYCILNHDYTTLYLLHL